MVQDRGGGKLTTKMLRSTLSALVIATTALLSSGFIPLATCTNDTTIKDATITFDRRGVHPSQQGVVPIRIYIPAQKRELLYQHIFDPINERDEYVLLDDEEPASNEIYLGREDPLEDFSPITYNISRLLGEQYESSPTFRFVYGGFYRITERTFPDASFVAFGTIMSAAVCVTKSDGMNDDKHEMRNEMLVRKVGMSVPTLKNKMTDRLLRIRLDDAPVIGLQLHRSQPFIVVAHLAKGPKTLEAKRRKSASQPSVYFKIYKMQKNYLYTMLPEVESVTTLGPISDTHKDFGTLVALDFVGYKLVAVDDRGSVWMSEVGEDRAKPVFWSRRTDSYTSSERLDDRIISACVDPVINSKGEFMIALLDEAYEIDVMTINYSSKWHEHRKPSSMLPSITDEKFAYYQHPDTWATLD